MVLAGRNRSREDWLKSIGRINQRCFRTELENLGLAMAHVTVSEEYHFVNENGGQETLLLREA